VTAPGDRPPGDPPAGEPLTAEPLRPDDVSADAAVDALDEAAARAAATARAAASAATGDAPADGATAGEPATAGAPAGATTAGEAPAAATTAGKPATAGAPAGATAGTARAAATAARTNATAGAPAAQADATTVARAAQADTTTVAPATRADATAGEPTIAGAAPDSATAGALTDAMTAGEAPATAGEAPATAGEAPATTTAAAAGEPAAALGKVKVKGLARRTRQGISWTAAGALASNVVRLGVYAALGRILSQTEFGVVAAAMTVIQLGNTIKDLGIGIALVQRKELEPGHVEAAFTFSVGLGALLGGAMFIAAGPLAAFYGIEGSVGLIRMLSLLFVLRGVSLVPSFLCRRNMRFRALTIVDLSGYVAGSAVSVGLALAGAGAWALAWGYLVETALNVAMLCALAPPPRRLRVHKRHLKDLLGFGMGQSAANLANYFANNGDYMVVGHFLGPAKLGLYQRAYELMRFPSMVFTNIAGSVLFSAFSRVQDDRERLGRAFRRTLFASAIVLLPASAGLIVLAPEVVRILLGKGWAGVEWPFRIMAASMLFRTTYKLGSLVGKSGGDVLALALWQVVYAVCVIGGALVSMHWDILGVATTTAISVFLQFLAMSKLGLSATTLRWRDVFTAHIEAVLFAALVGGVALAVATSLRAAHQSFIVVAAVTTAAGTLVFLGLALLAIRRNRGDWPWLRETLGQLAGKKKKRA
jgi:PST family polysaccharide transporter